MKQRALNVAKHGIIVLTLGILYGLFVTLTGIAIPCMFHEITGLQCVGCGITRMCLAIMRFDFIEAYSYNQGVFIMAPAIIGVVAHMIYKYIRYNETKNSKVQTAILTIITALLVFWGIIRNILVL